MLFDLLQLRHLRAFSMKPFHLLLHLLSTFGWLSCILILRAAVKFHKIAMLLNRFIPALNLSRIGNDLTLEDAFYLPL